MFFVMESTVVKTSTQRKNIFSNRLRDSVTMSSKLGHYNIFHRDRTRGSTLWCFGLFFSSFEHAKNLLIMGTNNTKTHH
jgi:hypothetical protein